MSNPEADELLEAINAFRRSRVILTAVELRVFDVVEKNGSEASDIARMLVTDARAIDRLLNALAGMKLLKKEHSRFYLTDTSARFLVSRSSEYLANIAHYNNLWERWSSLSEAVREGRGIGLENIRERGSEWLESFIAAMHHRAVPQAPEDVNLMDLHDVVRVLDLGGGSGAYSMAMTRVKQELRAVVFDLPEVVPITKKYIEQAGLSHRIDVLEGDYLVDDYDGVYDLVFLSAIIHSHPPEENIALLKRCASALRPGGSIVIQDFIMEDDRVQPVHGALFALNMLVATRAGDTYTEEEICSWMHEAGFSDVRRCDTTHGAAQMHARLPLQ